MSWLFHFNIPHICNLSRNSLYCFYKLLSFIGGPMKIQESFRVSLYLVLIFLIGGCNMPIFTSPQATLDRDQISTAAAQTIEVTFTLGALLENLNKPTLTITPSPLTIVPSATMVEFTPTVTNAPFKVPTNTPSYPMIHSTINTNCRNGPSSDYDVVGYLMIGDKVGVLGRNANSTWWVIQNPDNLSKICWVWNQTTIVEGNVYKYPGDHPCSDRNSGDCQDHDHIKCGTGELHRSMPGGY